MSISMLVTDGSMKWLETRQYFWYTKAQAKRLFKDYCKSNGLRIVK